MPALLALSSKMRRAVIFFITALRIVSSKPFRIF